MTYFAILVTTTCTHGIVYNLINCSLFPACHAKGIISAQIGATTWNRGSFFSWKEEVFLVLARENTIPYTTSKMHTTLNNRKFIFLEFLLKLHWVFLSWNCAEELHTTSFILYGSFVYISLRMLKYKVDKRCVI